MTQEEVGKLIARLTVRIREPMPYSSSLDRDVLAALQAMSAENEEYAGHVDRWAKAHDELGLKLEAAESRLTSAEQERDATKEAATDYFAIALHWKREFNALRKVVEEAKRVMEPFARVFTKGLTKSRYGSAWGFNGVVVEHEDFRALAALYATLPSSTSPTASEEEQQHG